MTPVYTQRTLFFLSLIYLCSVRHVNTGRSPYKLPNRNNQTSNRGERRGLQPQYDAPNYDDPTCPPADLIKPCVCSLDHYKHNMYMDCVSVSSEEELANAFAHDFPSLNFRELSIEGNQHLKVLRAGALGNATFQHIFIMHGVLQEVELYALTSSYHTAEQIYFSDNKISFFPFSEVNSFTKLEVLSMGQNDLIEFPVIKSPNLRYLQLDRSDFSSHSIGSEDLQQLPHLNKFSMSYSGLTEIDKGTFTRLPRLTEIWVFRNNLTHLPDGIIDLNDNPESLVGLHYNSIQSVALNAITGVTKSIHLEGNLLTELEEGVWRKHLEKGVHLWITENPLECGCDIAWIILNSTFMELVVNHPYQVEACADGTLLVDLDPSYYDNMC